MTQQVKRAYRKNRRATIFLVLAVVVAAAVAIPLASGAPDKTYTLSTSPLELCTGEQTTLTITLTNTAKTATLGSAEVTLPGVVVPVPGSASEGTLSGQVIRLENLELAAARGSAPGGSVTVTVDVDAPADGSGGITAVVKQANSFNDNQGDEANAFSNPTFQTLVVAGCTGTISGIVFNDVDESGTRTDGTGDTPNEALLNGWTVKLYEAGVPAGFSDITDANGYYELSDVPLNSDYVLCLESGDAGVYVQTTPRTGTPPTAHPDWTADLSECGSDLPDGYAFTFEDDWTTANFGVANALDAGCAPGIGPEVVGKFQTTSGVGDTYTVWLPIAAVCDSSGDGILVFEAYKAGDDRVVNLHGGNPLRSVVVVEQMEWAFDGTAQPDPANRSLKFDDTAPYTAPVPMQYCTSMPLSNPGFDPETETPTLVEDWDGFGGADITSCLASTVEEAGGNRVDLAVTKVDGYRLFP